MGKTNNRPLILVTNDDGIYARGLEKLVEVAREFGDVVVIAAEEAMSGMSHAITIKVPLRAKLIEERDGFKKYITTGTPVDGVKLAFNTLLSRRPDLLLSGINHGSNSSSSILYPGTMAAAMEGAVNHIPSAGFSLLDFNPDANFGPAGDIARDVIRMILKHGLPEGICLNVNVPSVPARELHGIKFCSQANGYWKEEFEHRTDPHGFDYFWLTGYFQNRESGEEGSDEWALARNYASVVPINTDFTAYSMLKSMKSWELVKDEKKTL